MLRKLILTLIATVCATVLSCGYNALAQNDEAIYDEVVTSIENYNKGDALQAAISAVDNQIPNFTAYYDMSFAPAEINGKVCNNLDVRYPLGGIGCGWGPKAGLVFYLGTADGSITKPDTEYNPSIDEPGHLANKSFSELISLAKASSAYTNDAEFKQFVDECEAAYNRGVKSLRTNLPKVDPTLINMDTKSSTELLAIYESLPIVKNRTYDELIDNYSYAYMLSHFISIGETIGDEELIETYGKLVVAAKAINPDFTVDLSSLATTPTAPDTGATDAEQFSATIVKVAVFGIATLTAGMGIAVVAKRYLFSPLKRR